MCSVLYGSLSFFLSFFLSILFHGTLSGALLEFITRPLDLTPFSSSSFSFYSKTTSPYD
jgi:hypothetical protein